MSKYKNLFLRQSYLDSYEEYEKSLNKENYPKWDYVVLTASNEAQAETYREQIRLRLEGGFLPADTHYAVLPDPDGKRVGSGGATLNVMKYIAEHRGSADFTGIKILCIHSGGDSKRVPQYSACGKLFSPVPRELPDGRRSTLFDEFIIGMTGVPVRISGGMLVCSGDVLLLFNPLQLDFYGCGAAALSIKENVSTGKNHGVFLRDNDGNVGRFLHKQTVETLTSAGAVDARGNVDIDTGAVIFDSTLLSDLYSLIDTDEKFAACVNEHVRLSFYADFLYPLASEATLEDFYKETPEGDFSPELDACREQIWAVLHKYKMKLLRFSPASFIHFGTTRELLKLMTDDMPMYSYLDWSANVNTNSKATTFAASNSYVSKRAIVGKGSYIEDSYIHKGTVGEGCVISGITLWGETVPDGTVLHGLKLLDGRFVVRMYGVNDNPKENKWFGKDIGEPLWTAKLFIPCTTIEEALKKTLAGERSDDALSLCSSFNMADAIDIPLWQAKLDDRVKVETFLEAIDNRTSLYETKKLFVRGITDRIERDLAKRADALNMGELGEFGKKIRIYYYLSKMVEDKKRRDAYANMCFDTICASLINASAGETLYRPTAKIAKDEVVVSLPVRVNFGGGWSDTPPYCNEHGGTVLNAAITLNGICPIEAVLKRLPENKIVLASEDNGSYREFTDISKLQSCSDPGDPFALHKAALLACGVVPMSESITMEELTARLGGGVYLSTQAINIPRGSGLGTSSILAGACVKAILEFLGEDVSDNELYGTVLCMEQLMSTGGGWQDQVGGLAKGFKMVSADAGLNQSLTCMQLNIDRETVSKLNERFALIYTGQRRLARNLLREIVGKYIASDPDTLEVLYEIQRVAVLMRFELEKGNIDGFCGLLNAHWELSKKLDRGCTNTCIDQIFNSVEDLIDGKMICGAGGGGFLQVVMKEGVTLDDLRERLDGIFAGSGVEVWSCDFVM
ncbi:MAG: bifunctional fucokinase/L-fucose-1-P-guanylyltransferase [Ruminococcaceae bacterium]|nr:bifunctional fucokinase/L-fucose-1-P-guanylyltransferase [Oscillospiraceae bacterium]